MEIFTELNDEHKNLSLALGFFDGIHLGHKVVIENAVNFAHQNNLKSAIITFSSHPAQKFNKNFEGYIMPPEKRLEYFEKLGVDFCWLLDFETLVNIEAENYIKDILVKNFSPKAITSGFNHNFGKNKSGNTTLLKELASTYNYEYFEIPPIIINSTTVSSSIIREFIRKGDIGKLNDFLGHNFEILGTVTHGTGIATALGFKTANISYPQNCVKLKYGVYGVDIIIDKKAHNGIANFGIKPTFNNNIDPILEVHILNFEENIYNKDIQVKFKNFIRDEKKFNTTKELTAQIKSDIKNNF